MAPRKKAKASRAPLVDLPPARNYSSFDDTPKEFKFLLERTKNILDKSSAAGKHHLNVNPSSNKYQGNQKRHSSQHEKLELPASDSKGSKTKPIIKSLSSSPRSSSGGKHSKNASPTLSKGIGSKASKSPLKRRKISTVDKVRFGEVVQAPPQLMTFPKPLVAKQLSPELLLIRERAKIQYQKSKLKQK
ncbi:hypothetical protein MDAP_000518 [Mitosporidium daphniae]